MSRIELTDTMMDVISKMSEGNPGAMMSIMEIMQKHDEIDPQAVMGGLGAIMILDTWSIYGTDIYVLFNDKCGRDVRTMLMIMRATQLGFFCHVKLRQLAADQMREVNITADELAELDKKVCERLTQFQKAA